MAVTSRPSQRTPSWRRLLHLSGTTTDSAHRSSGLPLVDDWTWHRVLQTAPTNTVFQTRPWLESWWEHFGSAWEAFPITLSDTGGTLGWAPLMRRQARNGSRQLSFVGDGNADYLDLIHGGQSQRCVRSLLGQLADRRTDWDEVVLNNIPRGSDTWGQLVEQAPAFGLYALCRPTQVCPALVIRGHEADAEALARKYSLRRPWNRMSRAGRLHVYTLTDEARVASLLPRFFDQHIDRWAASGRHSPFHRQAYRDFFETLWRRLAPMGWVRFSTVEFNDEAVAFHFGFDYGGRFLWYKPSFDPAYARYSPGVVLIKHLLDYVIEHERDELDFSIGAEAFKSRFANIERANLQVRLFHRRREYMRAHLGHRARSLLKSTLHRS